jgi:hypothetical protein
MASSLGRRDSPERFGVSVWQAENRNPCLMSQADSDRGSASCVLALDGQQRLSESCLYERLRKRRQLRRVLTLRTTPTHPHPHGAA